MLGTVQARTAGETVPCRKHPEDKAEPAKSTEAGWVAVTLVREVSHWVREVSHSFKTTQVSETKTGSDTALSDPRARQHGRKASPLHHCPQ